MRSCDGCTECCYYMHIEAIRKPACQSCTFEEPGYGCGIYNTRPQECHDFECLWLQTQKRKDPWPSRLRPDRCGTMFTALPGEDNRIAAHSRKPDALDTDPTVRKYVRRWLSNGVEVVQVAGPTRRLIRLVPA